MRLKNKTAVVTGAAGGMGKEICTMFAEEGADIIAVDINIDRFKETADEIHAIGRKSIQIKADVTKKEEVDSIFQQAEKEFGKIDILANVAGVLGKMDYALNQTEEDWYYCMDINAKGVFLVSLAAARLMIKNIKAKKQERGKIVNLASMVGRTGMALCAPYVASKFSVVGLTQALACEFAEYKINVNAICPGIVVTDMYHDEFEQTAKVFGTTKEEVVQGIIDTHIPLKELVYPKDIAYMAVYFASEEANKITGQSLNISGGHIMK
jgi:NAD(P)-dependent dehydrogenase (short-subunit alcohol dehydrogenase family)